MIGAFLLGAATGCSSPVKRQYLHHLTATVAPGEPDRDLADALAAIRGTSDGTAIAVAETEE